MIMHFIFKFILVSIFLVGSFFIFSSFGGSASGGDVLPKAIRIDNILKEITIGQTKFQVEVADTPALQAKGLSGHKALLENQGMLFIFKEPSMPGFWMKDMNFPIDIIWISDGKVVGIAENLLPDNSPSRPLYYPPSIIDRVLEITAGTVLKYNLKIGDDVE